MATSAAQHPPQRLAFANSPYPALVRLPDLELRPKARRLAGALMLRLRAWRVEQALTRDGLAALSGLPPTSIKRAERHGAISLDRFLALTMALGLSHDVTDLFIPRRRDVPAVVLVSRIQRRQRGRATRRARA